MILDSAENEPSESDRHRSRTCVEVGPQGGVPIRCANSCPSSVEAAIQPAATLSSTLTPEATVSKQSTIRDVTNHHAPTISVLVRGVLGGVHKPKLEIARDGGLIARHGHQGRALHLGEQDVRE